MMSPLSLALLTLLAAPVALALPFALDNTTLLENGQAAQQLNAEFMTLQQNSSCQAAQTACISGAFATCSTNSTWQTQRCPDDKQCFALPLIKNNGTFVACTSPNNAQSIIAATGASGGVIATSISNTTVPFPFVGAANATSSSNSTQSGSDDDDDCDDGDDNSHGNSTTNSTGNDGGCDDDDNSSTPASTADAATVTVTVTIPTSGAVTLPPSTRTFAPAEASSFISSLTASASVSVITVLPVSSAALATATGGALDGIVPSSVIHLTARPVTAVAATPSPTSAAPAAGGYSY